MDLEKVKKLIKVLEDSSLCKLQLKDEEGELVLEKECVSVLPPLNKEHTVAVSSLSREEVKVENVSEAPDTTSVNAPLVGIYYEASGPEEPPFVKVGSQVRVGDTLCIIEAMKMLNEIKAPVAGEIKAIHVKNGDILSYNQTLIEIGD
ncbi:MAG: acetyl-CoA carboxylase biotin carboxyl carrier protein [Lachnospiraceae bacterium]|nr:acetyl-CoA carboxylase biotin carboxyl carrier protein [Lachnospiraceae bacterium]